MPADPARDTLAARVDAIEAGYEFLLAYAAQGLATDEGSANSEQLRTFLRRMDEALVGLDEVFRAVIADAGRSVDPYEDFLAVLARDAASTRAALRLLTSREGVSSQLVDNLNASIHVRAMLTDVFLIDEAVKSLSR
jgi:hypothetical protein